MVGNRLSRGDITALTGIDNDMLTFWIRKEVLHADGVGKGPGFRVSFAEVEASLTAIMMQVRQFGTNIETLVAVSGLYHAAVAWGELNSVRGEDFILLSHLQHLMHGGEALQARRNRFGGKDEPRVIPSAFADEDIERASDLARRLSYSEYCEYGGLLKELTDKRPSRVSKHFRFFWQTKDGWKSIKGAFRLPTAQRDGVLALIAVDVDQCVYSVWNKVPDAPRRSTIDLKPAR